MFITPLVVMPTVVSEDTTATHWVNRPVLGLLLEVDNAGLELGRCHQILEPQGEVRPFGEGQPFVQPEADVRVRGAEHVTSTAAR